jgi:Rap1a immunity proteins
MSAGIRFVAVGLLAGLVLAQAAGAQSDYKSARYWMRKCTSPEANGQYECATYVRAMVEYDEIRGTQLGEKRFICAQGLTIGRAREVVVEYLGSKPDDLQLPFTLLAHKGLADAFPCSGDKAGGAGPVKPGSN